MVEDAYMEYLNAMEAMIKELKTSVEYKPNPQQDENAIIMMQHCLNRVQHLNKTQQSQLYAPRRNQAPSPTSTLRLASPMIKPSSTVPTSQKRLQDLRKRTEEEAILRMRAQLQYNHEQEKKKLEQAQIESVRYQVAQDFHKGKSCLNRSNDD
jgi:hypothetical protein